MLEQNSKLFTELLISKRPNLRCPKTCRSGPKLSDLLQVTMRQTGPTPETTFLSQRAIYKERFGTIKLTVYTSLPDALNHRGERKGVLIFWKHWDLVLSRRSRCWLQVAVPILGLFTGLRHQMEDSTQNTGSDGVREDKSSF